jgi:hypothetical protein
MCRIWFFVYPNLRQSAPFAGSASRRHFRRNQFNIVQLQDFEHGDWAHDSATFCGVCHQGATGSVRLRGHNQGCWKLASFQSELVYKKTFENCETDLDNFSEMMNGNDPRSYQLGPDWDRRNQVI